MDNFWKEVWESCKIRKAELFFFLIFAAAAIWMGVQTYQKEKSEADSGIVRETESHDDSGRLEPALPHSQEPETTAAPAADNTVQTEAETQDISALYAAEAGESEILMREERETGLPQDRTDEDEAGPGETEEQKESVRLGMKAKKAGSAETEAESEVSGTGEEDAEPAAERVDEDAKKTAPFIHTWRRSIAYLADDEVRGPVYPDLRCWRILPGMEIPEEFRRRTVEANLKGILQNMVDEASGDWSVWFRNLRTQETISVNPRPMKSASIMKLFVMGAVYHEIELGNLKRTDELISMLKDMVTYSDNEDSNCLLYMIGDSDYAAGVEKVNAFIRSCGFSDHTIEYNGFNSEELILDRSHLNQVTAEDSGKLLETIYRREWGSRQVSNEVEQMLINQTNHSKIPAGLPEGTVCGNKTGEMDRTENDAAIVYGPLCDYVLVVLSSDWDSMDGAVERIRRISRVVYDYTQKEMVVSI